MQYYTTQQLADLCGYTSNAIIRMMIISGKLKAEKFGHVWMIKHDIAMRNKNIAKRLSN